MPSLLIAIAPPGVYYATLIEECAYLHLDDYSHLLHAVVHANGYGHLLRVNGREGGSKFLTGHDIMSLWDRLCKVLHVR
jgi:hypothetical protein